MPCLIEKECQDIITLHRATTPAKVPMATLGPDGPAGKFYHFNEELP
jgi:hypothetical protein